MRSLMLLLSLTFTLVVHLAYPSSAAFAKRTGEGSEERVLDADLSKTQHFADGEHNTKYDQDAFLGEDASMFNKMTPEEGRKSLSEIFDKIDTNKNGVIDSDELENWLDKVNKKSLHSDISETWKEYNISDNEPLSWKQYKSVNLGENGEYADETEAEQSKFLARDKRRWDVADTNKDGLLTKTEALAFFHPEHEPSMKNIIVQETMEEIDKDHDGHIDLEEYISDLWRPSDGEKEPEWVQNEREEFANRRDTNHDGKMDATEVANWIIPQDYDHIQAEAKHILSQADDNHDGAMSKEEVLNHYDLFVGSQVTNYGELLPKHDEL